MQRVVTPSCVLTTKTDSTFAAVGRGSRVCQDTAFDDDPLLHIIDGVAPVCEIRPARISEWVTRERVTSGSQPKLTLPEFLPRSVGLGSCMADSNCGLQCYVYF